MTYGLVFALLLVFFATMHAPSAQAESLDDSAKAIAGITAQPIDDIKLALASPLHRPAVLSLLQRYRAEQDLQRNDRDAMAKDLRKLADYIPGLATDQILGALIDIPVAVINFDHNPLYDDVGISNIVAGARVAFQVIGFAVEVYNDWQTIQEFVHTIAPLYAKPEFSYLVSQYSQLRDSGSSPSDAKSEVLLDEVNQGSGIFPRVESEMFLSSDQELFVLIDLTYTSRNNSTINALTSYVKEISYLRRHAGVGLTFVPQGQGYVVFGGQGFQSIRGLDDAGSTTFQISSPQDGDYVSSALGTVRLALTTNGLNDIPWDAFPIKYVYGGGIDLNLSDSELSAALRPPVSSYDGPMNSGTWIFGDGQSSTGASAGHSYRCPGNYQVQYSSNYGPSAVFPFSFTQQIQVAMPWKLAYSTQSHMRPNAEYSFEAADSVPQSEDVTLSWNFGDGVTGSGRVQSHSFTQMGNYNVSLTATFAAGCTSTYTSTVHVSDPSGWELLPSVITEDTELDDGPIGYINQGTTISKGATLTVDPGVVVKSASGYYSQGFKVDGVLRAVGTSDRPVTFTSLKDDSVGGDTGGDGDASKPASSDWSIIASSGGTVDLSNTRVRYSYGITAGASTHLDQVVFDHVVAAVQDGGSNRGQVTVLNSSLATESTAMGPTPGSWTRGLITRRWAA